MNITGIGTQAEIETKKLWTGLAMMEVVGINPTGEELEEITGYKPKEEPVYTGNKDGVDTLSLDIWLRNEEHDITQRLRLFLEDRLKKESPAGNVQVINYKNQTTWALSVEDAVAKFAWYSDKNARRANVGEVEMYNFFFKWAGIDTKNNEDAGFVLSTDWATLISGDTSELDKLADMLKTRQVGVLLTVKDEQYQNVFTGVFGNYKKAYTNKLTEMEESAYPPNFSYGGSLTLKEYIPGEVPISTTSEVKTGDTDFADLMRGME